MKFIKVVIILLLVSYKMGLAQTTYPIVWTDAVNAAVNADNTVTGPLAGTAWTGGAASKNMLSPGVDGYVEFTYSSTGSLTYMVSLTRPNNNPSYVVNDYTVQVSGSALNVYGPQASAGSSLSTLVNGDVIRLSHESTAYKVYKNGVVIKTFVNGSITDYLRADVCLGNLNTTTPVIRCSFDVPLLATPVINNPSLANNDGSITVVLDGQTDPVAYSWSSGETTATITGKPRGAYTVTVTDALAKTFTRTYNLGYDVAWTNVKNLAVNADNSLTKTDAVAWSAGASSLNVLPPSTDGWVEFVVGDPGSQYMIGLSRIEENEIYNTIDACWNIQQNNALSVFEVGLNRVNLGSVRKGDIFRVAREGAAIKYYYNGVAKRTLPVAATVPYVIDVSSYAGTMPTMTSSFDRKIRVLPSFVLPDASNQGGSIALNIQGAYAPYNVSWSSGETSNVINNKPRGEYTVTITDAASKTFVRKYYLGYPVSWNDFQGTALTSDNAVYKNLNDGNGLWDAGALSATTLNAATNGWIECQLPPSTSIAMMGLSRSNSVPGSASIEYAYYFNNGDVFIYESGTYRNISVPQVEGSIFRIERENGFIKYWVDGSVIRTIATTSSYQLFADVAINKGRLSMITSSFARPPQTFYAIADGAWTDPNIWSLAEGGAPAAMYPANDDIAIIKANAVTVTSGITNSGVKINATSENATLRITGTAAMFTVKGNVELKGTSNAQTAKALIVENSGRINVVEP